MLTVSRTTWRSLGAFACFWVVTACALAGEEARVSDSLGQTLAEFNRGAALLEQYQYSKAAKAFKNVLEVSPDWTAARFNFGVAYFNMQGQEGARKSLEVAREAFQQVLQSDPNHTYAHFCLGLYYQYLGNNESALEHFRTTHRRDPEDPYVMYKYAETLIGTGQNEEGAKLLEQVLARDPGFVSAVYRLAMQYRRLKERDKAKPLLMRFKQLKAAELTADPFSVQNVYGSAGKYYMALGADNLPLPPPKTEASPRILFSPEIRSIGTPTVAWSESIRLPGLAAGDLDGDGDLDLCVTAMGQQGETVAYFNDGSGQFEAGGTVAQGGVAPCLADMDNDGDLDLWLGCAGADQLLENDGQGNFSPSESAAELTGGDLLTHGARMLDLDSDGDLDLLAFRLKRGSVPTDRDSLPAASSLFYNNRDGSFVDMAEELGLRLEDTPVAAAVYDDFDGDRDLDLAIFPARGDAAMIWVNDRVGEHRVVRLTGPVLATQGAVGATSGDPDKDGDRDLLVFTGRQVHLYVNRGGLRFEADPSFSDSCGNLGGTGGQFADFDNDGDLDILIADAHRRDGTRGPALLVNLWPENRFQNVAEIDPGNLLSAVAFDGDASCMAADFTGNGRCDILLGAIGEKLLLIENLTQGNHWIGLDLLGTRSPDKKSRSNNSAIGARVEIKTGRVIQQFVVGVPSGPVAAPPLRIHAGLGPHPNVQWLRILWPDAVLQAELELAGDQVVTITEQQRKTSSCPHLFAWDGSQFQFVADFGGVGGLGYFVAPGTYAPPDPTEYLVVPDLQPRDGQYVLQILEPLEEVVYFDEAKLIAVDHPIGTTVYPNEMMAITADPPKFEIFCYGQPIEPVRAVDHRGEDVTEAVARIDRRYAGATELDDRFTGFARPHFVELDFGDRLGQAASGDRLILYLHGWVEYPYSSTNYAAAQAGLRTEAPSIFVEREGQWVELFHEVGYPAGLQHMMTLDVTGKIRPGDRRIRITSNMELYWDRIFLASHLRDAKLKLSEAAAGSADLHFRGYPREYSPDGRHPNLLDYNNIDRAAAWKLMAGNYTRFGEVGPLLDFADDCYVIMGRGEELTLRFGVDSFEPIAAGCTRTFLLKTDSYCKDMDLHTAYPNTVGPLPFHGMSSYPYGPGEHYPENPKTKAYREKYNTRPVRGE